MAVSYSDYRYTYGNPGGYSFSFAVAQPPKPAPPAAPKFKEGDRVNVKIDSAAVIEYVNDDGTVDVKLDDGKALEYIPTGHVTLADPANWPPKVGQVWATPDGKLYGVRQYSYGSSLVIYEISQPNRHVGETAVRGRKLADFKALRPVLVQ